MSSHTPRATRVVALSGTIFVLAAAASYETAVALRVIPMGNVPGEGPFGGGSVLLIALLAMLTGLVVSLSGNSSRSSAWRPVALVVAVFIVVGFVASAAIGGVGEVIALLALLTGLVVSVSYASSRGAEWISVAPLVAPAAAAFVAARFYSFDPYYLPTLRRMSDGGMVAGRWIIALVALALLAAVATKIRPHIGIAMTSIVLLMSAVLAVGVGIGH